MEGVIGIDLGTTNSVVATVRNNRVEVIPDRYGNRLHPSVVAFVPNGDVLVGHSARARRHIDPRNTIYSAKRLIGQSIRNPIVRLALSTLPYQIEEGPNEQPMIVVRGRRYSVPEISAFVLMHLKQCAEQHLGAPVSKAVITVPANFTDSQRQATKQAGQLAGLKVLRILNEPTAAALAYGFGKALNAVLAIYDLGGGTFDVTVLQIRDRIFEVLATGGDSFLGGDDFDRALVNRLAGEFLERTRIDLRTQPEGWAKLQTACEQIKCRLSDDPVVAGTIHDLAVGAGGKSVGLDFEISRQQFESLIEPYVERSVQACREVLAAAGLEPRDLTDLILVGGSTRTPLVRTAIEQQFHRKPQARINPDETVAYGAALQAAALTSGHADPAQFYSLLLDVAPRALGIAVAGGYNETIIERNTPIPVERTRKFITSKDFQTRVDIQVSQGEAKMFADNEKLGTLELHDLEPAKRGETEIEVTFTIDVDGILSVRAIDTKTGRETRATMRVIGAPSPGADTPDADPQHLPRPA
ncbi:MAG: molecular chaperone DnaK [Deltaproteobacteria bacterium]|nr:MAG: molecular chaperone DnaK [Deltaproteobacteria bacterium]